MIRLLHAGAADFEEVFSLMDRAFPKEEHRTKEGQRALLGKPGYSLRTVRGEDGHLLGFLSVWRFDTFRFGEHFAVDDAARGKGLGSEMMRAWLQEEQLPAVLEVELPETDFAKRRIGFYNRLGFALNTFPYVQPEMQPGAGELPLLIMSWPDPVGEQAFRVWNEKIRRTVYGVPG